MLQLNNCSLLSKPNTEINQFDLDLKKDPKGSWFDNWIWPWIQILKSYSVEHNSTLQNPVSTDFVSFGTFTIKFCVLYDVWTNYVFVSRFCFDILPFFCIVSYFLSVPPTVPPTVEPVYTEIRQALGRAFSLTCRLLRAHPARLLRYEWKLGSRLLTVGQFSDQRDDTNYLVRALNREGYGEYTCDITNEAGAGRCTFLVTGESAWLRREGTLFLTWRCEHVGLPRAEPDFCLVEFLMWFLNDSRLDSDFSLIIWDLTWTLMTRDMIQSSKLQTSSAFIPPEQVERPPSTRFPVAPQSDGLLQLLMRLCEQAWGVMGTLSCFQTLNVCILRKRTRWLIRVYLIFKSCVLADRSRESLRVSSREFEAS